jgi:cell wall assembly regulator SMI1
MQMESAYSERSFPRRMKSSVKDHDGATNGGLRGLISAELSEGSQFPAPFTRVKTQALERCFSHLWRERPAR